MTPETESLGSTQKHDSFQNLVKRLQSQFLCCYPVRCIKWEHIPSNLSWEQQAEIINNTSGHALNLQYPVKLDYQLNFLKHLVKALEQSNEEIHDDVYKALCDTQANLSLATVEKYAYKHYLLPEFGTHLSVREAKSFVSEGTTGLCTWQASIALADYLLHHTELVQERSILELGSGTGICGMILMKCTTVKQFALTDGSMDCIQLLRENIRRNFVKPREEDDGFFELASKQLLGAYHFPWECIDDYIFPQRFTPELLLAADVVYDDTIFGILLHAIDAIFKLAKPGMKMLLAATVRSEDTLRKFLELVQQKDFEINDCIIVPVEKSYLHWDRTTPVRILELKRLEK